MDSVTQDEGVYQRQMSDAEDAAQAVSNFTFDAFHEFRCAEDPVIVLEIDGPCSEVNFTFSLEEARELVEEIQAAIENAESSIEAPE